MTNAEKVRKMTEEELAKWLGIIAGCSICSLDYTAGECNESCNSPICVENKVKWLKQEAEVTE